MSYVLGCIVCYLLGAVPFSVLFSRGMLHKDVRRYGSGNPGTSNMTRAFGIKYGLLVLLFDMAKGFGAVYLGQWIMGPLGAYLGALCAVAGHNWPIYLKFKGGKGVATIGAGVYIGDNAKIGPNAMVSENVKGGEEQW